MVIVTRVTNGSFNLIVTNEDTGMFSLQGNLSFNQLVDLSAAITDAIDRDHSDDDYSGSNG